MRGPLPQAPEKVSFVNDVLPILKPHCGSCHSGESASAGLDLTTAAGVQRGGASGALIVPGNARESLLIQRLLGENGMTRMPMGFAPLPESQMKVIRQWIAEGGSTVGKAEVFWTFAKPQRPKLPASKASRWVRNPIDAFVLYKLEKSGLHPSEEAAKETLLRRVYLDLIGIPPTPKEVDAYLADKRPDAYERVVDRLLASPHFGERQARPWLDLARYADSNGFEKDANRIAFKYRDWVIDAYNANMPYDQFVVKQLAGDLLPNPSLDDLIATGFNRNTMFNQEGGVDPEEGLFEAKIDRVSTTGVVFTGITYGCARCHDHKYDPFSQKEFYQLLAFFGNPEYVPKGDPKVSEMKFYEPEIEAPTPEQAAKRGALRNKLAQLKARLASLATELKPEQARWEQAALRGAEWSPLALTEGQAKGGSTLKQREDGVIEVGGPTPNRNTYTLRLRSKLAQPVSGLRLEALPGDALPNKGPGRAGNGNFLLSRLSIKANGKPVTVTASVADFEQRDFPIKGVFDENPDSGWGISPQFGKRHEAVFTFQSPLSADSLEIVLEHEGRYDQHALGAFRLSVTSESNPVELFVPEDLRGMLTSQNRKPEEQAKLDAYFISVAPSLAGLRSQVETTQSELSQVQGQIPTALVMRDKPGVPTAYFRNRGEFTNKGDLLEPGIPAAWNPMPKDAPKNRLGLARWIVSKDNPLTARVEVNRIWQQYFGRGIVETAENFGTQSAPPSHQQLLDWLAVEFMESGWDRKAIHRLIVTSATYRQTSDATKELMQKDPGNMLLARGPRYRMEAEMIRDNALAVAGLLSEEIGGPSVYPVQPEGVWNTPYNGERWMTSNGENRYRRGLYTFVKRTSPYPSFMTFDATSRETCTARRVLTNTPLQALTLMNDPAYLEAAKALAGRMMKEGGATDSERIGYGFRLCTCRLPEAGEGSRLAKLVRDLRKRYTAKPDEAKKLASGPEEAVWTMVANVLLNLDETITKE